MLVHNRDREGFTNCYMQLVAKEDSSKVGCAVLCCAVLYCAVLCYAVLYCTVLYCTILCCTVPLYATLSLPTLDRNKLHGYRYVEPRTTRRGVLTDLEP